MSVAVFILFLIAVLTQVADGWLTYQGVMRYGIGMEGNMMIRAAMGFMGPVAALAFFKGAGILILSFVYLRAPDSHIGKPIMFGSVSLFYLFVAIIPWLVILYKK